jgi:hypothetical protein
MSFNGIAMSLNENLFLALIYFATLIQQKNNNVLILKLQSIMKKLHSNLAVVKSTVSVFDNNEQKEKKGTLYSFFCHN